jgi:hypothetical protein
LPGLLDGSLDAAKLQEELQHSPVAEVPVATTQPIWVFGMRWKV